MSRSSLWRILSKWGAGGAIQKPVALLTAFIEEPQDFSGSVPADKFLRQRLNQVRNQSLKNALADFGLSYYPVVGAGQSQRKILGFSYIAPSEEESFVVQPRGEMPEVEFLTAVQRLLVQYDQYAAAVRIPSDPAAFLLLQSGEQIPLGTSAEPRHPGEPYYTALTKGPRADDEMLDPWEIHGERNPLRQAINWFRGQSNMNRPREVRGGRRFVIKNPEPAPKVKVPDAEQP